MDLHLSVFTRGDSIVLQIRNLPRSLWVPFWRPAGLVHGCVHPGKAPFVLVPLESSASETFEVISQMPAGGVFEESLEQLLQVMKRDLHRRVGAAWPAELLQAIWIGVEALVKGRFTGRCECADCQRIEQEGEW